MIVLNPSNGASINNWKASDLRFYSLEVGEQMEINDKIGKEMVKTFGFLISINPETIDEEIKKNDEKLAYIDKKNLNELNIEEINEAKKRRIEGEILKFKKQVLNKSKAKKAKGLKDNEVDLKKLPKGELIRMCIDKNIDRNIIKEKRKEQLIQLLNN